MTGTKKTELKESKGEGEKERTEGSEESLDKGKKRGRKPKGGKITPSLEHLMAHPEPRPSVILHLRCSLNDLAANTHFSQSEVEGYSFTDRLAYNHVRVAFEDPRNDPRSHDKKDTRSHDKKDPRNDLRNDPRNNDKNIDSRNVDPRNNDLSRHKRIININLESTNDDAYDTPDETEEVEPQNMRLVWKKLKMLEHTLHTNMVDNRKSCCFWDTCEFDNPPIYIPKYLMNETYQVYGCFCSPECAVAHLMEENIDSSVKFERYQMVNHIYAKVYNYTKNIKPAPNPYYLLEKYYGNLNIQEYRALLRNERLFLVVDKPLTRVMPELHEDNADFILNNKVIPSNPYQLQKKKKQTKTTILSEQFGGGTN